MNSHRLNVSVPAALLAMVAGVCPSLAGTNTFFNGTGDNNWLTGANWSLGHYPNINDDAVIPVGQAPSLDSSLSLYVNTLTVNGNFYMQGSLRAVNGFTLNGQMSVYKGTHGAPFFFVAGQGTINGTMSLFGGSVLDNDFYNNTGEITISNGGHLAIYDSDASRTLSINTVNYGTIDFYAPRMDFGAGIGVSRSMFNYGSFNNFNNGTFAGLGTSSTIVYNEGNWNFTAPGAALVDQNVIFVNDGNLIVDRATATFGNLFNLHLASNELTGGFWQVSGGGQLKTPAGGAISKIGAGAAVAILGANSLFDALFPCTSIDGTLIVDGGATLSLYPPALGTVTQSGGYIGVGAYSHLYVQGAFWQRGGTIGRQFQDATQLGSGIFDVLLTSTFSGNLFCLFLDQTQINAGNEFTIAKLAPSACCGVYGPFASIEINGNGNRHLVTRYDQDKIVLVGLCPSDFDGDGFVAGDDFDAYVVEFQFGNTSADFDGDGFVTGDDFDAFVAAFELGC